MKQEEYDRILEGRRRGLQISTHAEIVRFLRSGEAEKKKAEAPTLDEQMKILSGPRVVTR